MQIWLVVLFLALSVVWSSHIKAQDMPVEVVNNHLISKLNLTPQEVDFLKYLPVLKVPLISHQPPLSYIENGQAAGYLNSLLDDLVKKLGISIQRTTQYSYAESVKALKENKVDLLNDYSAFGVNREAISHSSPVLTIPFVAVGRTKDKIDVKTIEQLVGKTLVLVSGFQQTKIIQQRYPLFDVIIVDNIDQAYRSLRTKEADFYIDNATHAGYFLRSKMITDLQIRGEFSRDELGVLELRFAVNSDQPLLLSVIEKSLKALSNRDIQLLRDKWILSKIQQHTLNLTDDERNWLNEHPTIRLASDNAWLPFETIDEKGRFKGIAADYMQLIEKRLNIKFTTSPSKPWSEITGMVKSRQLDVLSCAMETDQRKEYAIFTDPYVSNPMIIVTRKNIGYIDGLNGLQGKKIAIEKGYASNELLAKNHPELLLQPHKDSLSAVLAVSKGQAFAYIGNIANLSYILRTHGITNTKVSGQVPYSFELSMGVRSDWPELVPLLQKALDSISVEEKNAILQKWIGIDLDQKFDYTLIWQLAAVVLILFVVIIYWNLMLKKKVQERTAQLQRQAHFDALTGLPNRVLAFDRLNQLINDCRRKRQHVALLFLDLDDFKKINDTLGHDTGDKLLMDAADRLRSTLRAGDTIGRLGGDEFIVVFGGLNTSKDAGPVAENLIDKFREAFMHEGRELLLTASVGIAIYPHDGETPAELLKNADSAMYHSKRQGRNTYCYFDESMNAEVTRRLLLEEHMNNALKNNEFELLYQPKVDIRSSQIVGAEALLRWNSPTLGNISPIEFIPIAEHNGIIIPIGEFVMKQSLSAVSDWLKAIPTFTIAVNMSPRQFRDPGLVEHISNIIQQSGVTAASLEIEITEGILMSGHSIVGEALAEFKKLGITIAMDDFGTGYSSLSYLRKYPFDVLKIDREFINDIFEDKSDQELVYATIGMAHALGLKVVAEGVETSEQLEFLDSSGCDQAQGYLFSKPVSKQELSHLLELNRKTWVVN